MESGGFIQVENNTRKYLILEPYMKRLESSFTWGLYSRNWKTSYRQILWSHDTARGPFY